ncbi:MAG: hypothetical protein R3236_01475 [Phycisphaeraceae bacterium]|nr:hypothetical protein [Phycisphaeraceae bacterium]
MQKAFSSIPHGLGGPSEAPEIGAAAVGFGHDFGLFLLKFLFGQGAFVAQFLIFSSWSYLSAMGAGPRWMDLWIRMALYPLDLEVEARRVLARVESGRPRRSAGNSTLQKQPTQRENERKGMLPGFVRPEEGNP